MAKVVRKSDRPRCSKPVRQCRMYESHAASVRKLLKQLFHGSSKRGSGRNALRWAKLIEQLARKGQSANASDAVRIICYIETLVSMLTDEMDQILMHPGRQTFRLRFRLNCLYGVSLVKTVIGKTIRILRTAKGKSLRELAKDAGLSVPFLSLVESGKRQPSLTALQSIGKALKVPPEVLLMLGMGPQSKLKSTDPNTIDITKSIEKLIDLERKLKSVLQDVKAARGSD